jgi:hypothetical protein
LIAAIERIYGNSISRLFSRTAKIAGENEPAAGHIELGDERIVSAAGATAASSLEGVVRVYGREVGGGCLPSHKRISYRINRDCECSVGPTAADVSRVSQRAPEWVELRYEGIAAGTSIRTGSLVCIYGRKIS